MLLLRRRFKVPSFPTYCTSQLTIFPGVPFSSLSSAQPQKPPIPPEPIPKPSSLSARLNFVFDQIDAIEKERSQKDQTLQRIRAWRESKKQSAKEVTPDPVETTGTEKKLQEFELMKKDENAEDVGLLNSKREVELVHPWPEWIELMERLVQQNYFDHKRKDEEGMIENLGFNLPEMVEEEGFDFTRDFKTVQTAVLNFGRDRFDIMRSLSRQDLQILVGYGCPSAEKKVVFSAKLLRKHVHLDEGDVCSTCSLRSTCERAYLLTNKEDEARTIDVMRVLLTYGFDAVNGSVTNKSLLNIKSLKNVVRKLIHEVVKLSAVPIDPNLPPPVIKKPPPKVKQPPPPPKKRVGRDDVEMKKGDWLCVKCDFMNFAKNTVCLQCDAKRPKRQLLPGEWECPQCNFLNYRRNTICFHCEHKRPPEEFVDNPVQERQHSPRRMDKMSGGPEISNAWNFDFDDNESDGADVAAFEYADSKIMKEDFTLDKQAHGGIARGHEDGFYKGSRPPRLSEKEYSDAGPSKSGLGFDDFDDEDDDLDSYELDTRNEVQKASTLNFSDLEVDSFTEDDDTKNHDWTAHHKSSVRNQNKQSDSFSEDEDNIAHNRNVRRHSNYRAQNKPSQSRHQVGFSGSDNEVDFGTDDDLPIHPNWKSSHVNQRSKGRGSMSFGSGDELSSDSDYTEEDDFGTKQKKGNKWRSNGSSRKQRRFNFDDEASSDVESKNNRHFDGKSFRGGKAGLRKGKATDRGMDRKRNPTRDSFSRSSQSSRGKSFEDGDGGYRMNPRNGHSKNFKSPRREVSYKQRQDRYGNSSKQGDSYLDGERFQRPRLNVR